MSTRRVRAILAKELREYRRNGFIVWTMAIVPLFFVLLPMIEIFVIPSGVSPTGSLLEAGPLTYMLGIPIIVPTTVAAYAVVGERQQGTLEPVLTTPVRDREFLLGKALAVILPTLVISYAWYGVVLVCAGIFARPVVVSAVFRGGELLAQLFFTPLLAGWSIWVGIAISARSSDVRVAQQLGSLASLPPLGATLLFAFDAVHATFALALGMAAVLLVLDGLGWRLMSAMFDRERLIIGAK